MIVLIRKRLRQEEKVWQIELNEPALKEKISLITIESDMLNNGCYHIITKQFIREDKIQAVVLFG